MCPSLSSSLGRGTAKMLGVSGSSLSSSTWQYIRVISRRDIYPNKSLLAHSKHRSDYTHKGSIMSFCPSQLRGLCLVDLHVDLDPLRHEELYLLSVVLALLVYGQDHFPQFLLKERGVLHQRLPEVYLDEGDEEERASGSDGDVTLKVVLLLANYPLDEVGDDDDAEEGNEDEHEDELGVVGLEHGEEGVHVLGVLVVEQDGVELAHVEEHLLADALPVPLVALELPLELVVPEHVDVLPPRLAAHRRRLHLQVRLLPLRRLPLLDQRQVLAADLDQVAHLGVGVVDARTAVRDVDQDALGSLVVLALHRPAHAQHEVRRLLLDVGVELGPLLLRHPRYLLALLEGQQVVDRHRVELFHPSYRKYFKAYSHKHQAYRPHYHAHFTARAEFCLRMRPFPLPSSDLVEKSLFRKRSPSAFSLSGLAFFLVEVFVPLVFWVDFSLRSTIELIFLPVLMGMSAVRLESSALSEVLPFW